MSRLIVIILMMSIFLLTLQSCKTKKDALVEVESPLERAKRNQQTKKIPLNEYASDQWFNPENDIPIDPDIYMGVFENGMSYYIKENKKPASVLELRLIVKAGSLNENENQKGLAHFIEHMAFNGTEHFEKNDLVKYLESQGARFGPDLNASTSFERTTYKLQIKVDRETQIDTALMVLKDWAFGISFDSLEIEKERGVVLAEWRSRLSSGQRMLEQYFPLLYKGSKYADRMPIGDPDIIKNASQATIKSFYNKWYRPELMAIVIVGDTDLAIIKQKTKQVFGSIDPSPKPKKVERIVLPDLNNAEYIALSDKEEAFTNIQVIYRKTEKVIKTQEALKEKICQNLFTSMLNTRLEELSQKADPPFTFAYSRFTDDLGNSDRYMMGLMADQNKIENAFRSLLIEYERAIRFGFLESELERKKASLLKRAKSRLREQQKTQSSRIAITCINHFLEKSPLLSASQNYSFYKAILPQITPESFTKTIKELEDLKPFILITAPENAKAKLPEKEIILNLLKDVKATELDRYSEEMDDEPLINFEIEKGSVLEKNYDKVTGMDKIILDNGIEIYLKSTKFKNDEVLFYAFSDGGSSLMGEDNYLVADFLPDVMYESGLSVYSRNSLDKKLEGKNLQLNLFLNDLNHGFRGSSSTEDLESLFQLLYLNFKIPRYDSIALKSIVSKYKNIYGNLMNNPEYWFYDQISRIKYNNDKRVSFPNAEELDMIEMEKIVKFHKDLYSNPGTFKYVLVGNYNKYVVIAMLQKYLGSLKFEQQEFSYKDIGPYMVEGHHNKSLQKGDAPKSLVNMTWYGEDELDLDSRARLKLFEDVLSTRLREKLREEEGAVYGVNVNMGLVRRPVSRFSLNVSFKCDPDKTDKLLSLIDEEIAFLKDSIVDQQLIKNAKSKRYRSREKQLEINQFWLNEIVNSLQYKSDIEEIYLNNLKERWESIEAKDVKETAKKVFSSANSIKLVMNPDVDLSE